MKASTQAFLILLRVAIGWHLMVEGIDKLQSIRTGPTPTNRPFSSAGYLRESTGPLRPFFLLQAGDPDAEALAKLTPKDLPAGQDPATAHPSARLPDALAKELDAHLERFQAHYELDDRQKARARAVVDQHKAAVATWLVQGEKPVEKPLGASTYTAVMRTPERVAAYRAALDKARRMEDTEFIAFGEDVRRKELRDAKAAAARLRTELLADLDDAVTYYPPTAAGGAAAGVGGHLPPFALAVVLTPEQRAKPPLPPPPPDWKLVWTDRLVSWGLTLTGIGLLLGLLTRFWCVSGAAFLLMFYLAHPPWPWLPENLRDEGHYLMVNKNLIEMLALLALATTASGRWFGLDGLLHYLNPFRRRQPAPAVYVTQAPGRAPAKV